MTARPLPALLLALATLPLNAETIPRRIPPPGIPFPEKEHTQLTQRLAALQAEFQRVKGHPDAPDAETLLRAVRLALHHRELYKDTQLPLFGKTLDLAARRIQQLRKGEPLNRAHGLQVRGYRSAIDGSAQPYGLEIPEDLDLSPGAKKAPLYVWLHGRGDKTTDLYFIQQRLTKPGQFKVADGIVLHPFGRHCMGFKSAGEVDVLDAIDHATREYPVDPDRIALMGFSMGGAGAWHIGAHYAGRFAAVHPGAGFAETARYNRLQPADYPHPVVQQLWGNYDVPAYARNLLNVPLVAYSGETDKQKQAADLMAESLAQHGHTLHHVIGKGMGHKYDETSRQQILLRIRQALAKGRDRHPGTIHLQTRTLRYHRLHWLEITGLQQHWQDSRADATYTPEDGFRITTRNLRSLRLHLPTKDIQFGFKAGTQVHIDGQPLATPRPGPVIHLLRTGKQWAVAREPHHALRKRPGLQGPIDDAFLEPFAFVTPSHPCCAPPAIEKWIQAELQHATDRWRALYRAEPRIFKDAEVTREHIEKYHLVLWGTPRANTLLGKTLPNLPIQWDHEQLLAVNGQTYDPAHHIPLLIHPNPLNPRKYILLNSGPTHREAHDRTNSLQNPRLGDWAVIDVRQKPSAEAPGRIADRGFFNEQWQWPQ